EPESVELLPIRGSEPTQVTGDLFRLEERCFDFADRGGEDVPETARARRPREPVELRQRDRTPNGERALHLTRDLTRVRTRKREVFEKVVERTDAASQKRRSPAKEIELDALDVGAVRDDEPRVMLEHIEVALEKQRHLSGMRRPDHQREAHS